MRSSEKHSCSKADKASTVQVRELISETGDSLLYEHFESFIPISLIDSSDKNKLACEACSAFGNNFACPPFSPGFADFAGSSTHAQVICIRMPLEYFRHVQQEKIYEACFHQARALLVDELMGYRKRGYLTAGCGYCQACEVCGAEQGFAACIKPEKMIYSLESMGVNLTGLTKTCFPFELEWSADDYGVSFVCAMGAVLHNR